MTDNNTKAKAMGHPGVEDVRALSGGIPVGSIMPGGPQDAPQVTAPTKDQAELARCSSTASGETCGGYPINSIDSNGMSEIYCGECERGASARTETEARDMWQRLNRAHSPRGVSAVEAILSQAVKHLQTWLDLDECECEMGEHRCGRDEVEQTVSAALAALDPVP